MHDEDLGQRDRARSAQWTVVWIPGASTLIGELQEPVGD